MFDIVLVAVIVILLSILFISNRRPHKAPPGPWGFPILGHLPLMSDNPAKALLKWREIYGPIISVRFGSINTVVFNDIQSIKEAFNRPELSGRKDIGFFVEATGGKGIIFGTGPQVYEQRRFVQRTMNQYGIRGGNTEMETVLHSEISELLNTFKANSGQPMRIHHVFHLSTINALWLTVTGKRFEHGDSNLHSLAEKCAKLLEGPEGFEQLCVFMPWLATLLPNLSGYNRGLKDYEQLIDFIQSQISELMTTRVKDQPRHLIDAYSDKVENTTDENSSFFPAKNFLPFAISDMFLAGIDTTSTLLEWVLTYLAVHQDVQKKLQKEIFEITGNTRAVSLADHLRMPYTDAVIQESFRKSTFFTFSIGKEALEDTPFREYVIPKGTNIFANFYALFNDPDVWGDPENFRPERFIDESGHFVKPDAMIPFGYGKRVCIGETLAKDQSFLYVTSIFQKFNVNCVPGKDLNLQTKFLSIAHPDALNEVVLTERS